MIPKVFLKITMTPRVAQQLLNEWTPEQQKVFEEAAEAFVKGLQKDGDKNGYRAVE